MSITRRDLVLGLGAACCCVPLLAQAGTDGSPDQLELAVPAMRRIAKTTWVSQLTQRVWIHTTTTPLGKEGFYPANGLVVESEHDALLIDTGWELAQTRALLRFWKDERKRPIRRALVTHFHQDRLAGIPVLRASKIPVFANPLTIGLALEHAMPLPDPLANVERAAQQLGDVEVSYPGTGHTIDNIVGFVAGDGVLFGGCLVKSTTATTLGYMADAMVNDWPTTIANVHERYPDAKYVVPGHGTISGDCLAHTYALAQGGS